MIDSQKRPPMTVMVTFDDGPHLKYTPQILATLEKYKVRSIFFEVGQNVGAPGEKDQIRETKGAEYTRQILKAGHLVANHTWSHQNLPRLNDETLAHEIDLSRRVLESGADEQVADRGPNGHSIFTWTVLQGLDGRADLNGDGYITASELAAYVAPAVSQLSHQTPAFGSMVGSEGGEFVLELNHQAEFLTDQSTQLDTQAIALNSELDHVRKLIAEKEARNKELQTQLANAQAQLASLDTPLALSTRGALPATRTPEERARRENDRGMILYREKKYPEALGAFQSAAGINPKDAQAANNVGFLLFRLGRTAEATPWLEKTVAIDSHRGPAYANLGDAYAQLGKKPEAAKAYARYLELMPKSPLPDNVRKKLAQLK